MLLKPWRVIIDLKSAAQTWQSAFKDFVSTAPKKELDIMTGIQYFYKCESAAQWHPKNEADIPRLVELHHHRPNNVEYEPGEDIPDFDEFFSEAGPVASLITSQTPFWEESHGHIAVELTKQAQIFSEDNSTWTVQQDHALANTTGADIQSFTAPLDTIGPLYTLACHFNMNF